jgi:hypothetical protein
MKFNIPQDEVMRILEMHSKMKKPIISEQKQPEAPKENPDETLKNNLQIYVNAGCIANSKVVEMPGGTADKKFAVEQTSTKNPQKKRYYFSDFTWGEFVDGKFVQNPTPWECDDNAKLQQAFMNIKTKFGWKFNLTPEQIASGEYGDPQTVPGSEKFFPPKGIQGYFSAGDELKSGGSIEGEFDKSVEDQTPKSKNDCRDTIRAYYEAWRTKKNIPDIKFNPMKRKVQACVNEFDGEWGGILSKIDEYVKTLRGVQVGKIKGPLTYGSDSKWRLK